MRLALFSDVHANLPALRAVLADVETRSDIDAAYHLGDLVGYAPWPNETVDLIARHGITGVSGNYDSTVALGYDHCGCKYEDPKQAELSHKSFEWTCRNTSEETKTTLLRLPFRLDIRPLGGHLSGPSLILIHGGPAVNTLYWTEDKGDEFCRKMSKSLGARPGDAIAFGHTHVPWTKELDGVTFINTGSVGRPKDGDWRAGYVILDFAEKPIATFERIEYEIEEAQKGIMASELPNEFAEHLASGKTG
ncbi:MAG: metallophosphatase family protein [Gemmatimonadota bacterium]|nr:metallophosphatase family protein [Gemmatimonadota bacterium]